MLIFPLMFLFAFMLLFGICMFVRAVSRQEKKRERYNWKEHCLDIPPFFHRDIVSNVILKFFGFFRRKRNTESLPCRVIKDFPRSDCPLNIPPPVIRDDSLSHCLIDDFRE